MGRPNHESVMSAAQQLAELNRLMRSAIDGGDCNSQLAIVLRMAAIVESLRCEYPRIAVVVS